MAKENEGESAERMLSLSEHTVLLHSMAEAQRLEEWTRKYAGNMLNTKRVQKSIVVHELECYN